MRDIGLKYGFITMLGYVVYFIIMKLLGFADNIELRLLNFLIMIGGIALAVRAVRKDEEMEFTYYTGFTTGMITVATSVMSFSILLFIYLTLIDPAFLNALSVRDSIGNLINPFLLSLVIFFEGVFSGFLATYIVMQYEKAKTGRLNA